MTKMPPQRPPPPRAPIFGPSSSSKGGGRILYTDPEMQLVEVPGRVYVVHVYRHLSRGLLANALNRIWGSPGWRQPWGLVITLSDGLTYDPDVRKHEMPPNDRRAVGTAVVTARQLTRMIINSIGVGYRTVSRFVLTAHETLEEGVTAQRELVVTVERAGRSY